MKSTTLAKLFYGTVIQPIRLNQLTVARHTVIGVNYEGKIVLVKQNVPIHQFKRITSEYNIEQIIHLHDHQFLLPGFIDTHIHAPQCANAGNGLDLQLLEWLDTYTFREEARFKDIHYTEKMYRNIVRKTLRTGTTCAAYFATLHKEATIKLIDIMRDLGQRGWVGKVCMNQNAPSWYQETPEQSIMDTKAIIQYVRDTDAEAFANASIEKQKRQLDSIYHTCGLVEACITPRFAPHCTAESMKQMGQLAVEEGVKNSKLDSRRSLVPIQSHLSENRKEVEWVRSLFPEATSYTDVYDRAGLLTPRTIMAHGIYLSKEERECIKKTGSAIAHCAHSNFNLRSGVLNVRRLLDEGIKVALGTDVSGGHSSSMLDAMRSAITASHVICMMQEDDTAHAQLSIPEVLYMATVGGAMAMGLEDRVGSLLNVGYEMDALLVDVYANDQALLHISDHTDRLPSELSKDTGSTLPIQKWYLDMLEKFIMCGDDRHILYVWVRGRCVAENKTTNMDIIHK